MAAMPSNAFPLVRLVGVVCWALLACVPAFTQEASSAQEYPAQTVLHVESREAVIEVIARDRHKLTISDLSANEFQVYEIPEHGEKIVRRILYLRTIDPDRKDPDTELEGGFHVSSGAICALNASVHYQLAIQASSEPGYHTVLVKTTRPHVSLTFRRQYYVGHTRGNITRDDLKNLVSARALREAACFHPLTTPTLTLTAKVVETPGADTTLYSVVIKPESLTDIGLSGSSPHVQLDVGMCRFDPSGEIADYLSSTVDRQLDAAEVARLSSQGYISYLKTAGSRQIAIARLAVIDRNTGNLGIVDVSRPLPIAAQAIQTESKQKTVGDIRAFGAVTPSKNSFCGDVYELPDDTLSLRALKDLDPVASLYTNTLNVPNQNITRMGGIPGITHNSRWFGIDYYGKFYVTKPGKYSFDLQSDDGARLEIDNNLLIDLDGFHPVTSETATTTLSSGWHSIHVPYFQGPPAALALVLRIQPPGESMRPFNLNEFVP